MATDMNSKFCSPHHLWSAWVIIIWQLEWTYFPSVVVAETQCTRAQVFAKLYTVNTAVYTVWGVPRTNAPSRRLTCKHVQKRLMCRSTAGVDGKHNEMPPKYDSPSAGYVPPQVPPPAYGKRSRCIEGHAMHIAEQPQGYAFCFSLLCIY